MAQVSIDEQIAYLKKGLAELIREEELRERFMLETRAAGRLQHPAIVTIYDADIDPVTGDPYLAMEWV
ncbi:MAG: serine/threonine protein kinase, partial [bacterium]|nr:serine/threonine protein kinase [bacterium]